MKYIGNNFQLYKYIDIIGLGIWYKWRENSESRPIKKLITLGINK